MDRFCEEEAFSFCRDAFASDKRSALSRSFSARLLGVGAGRDLRGMFFSGRGFFFSFLTSSVFSWG